MFKTCIGCEPHYCHLALWRAGLFFIFIQFLSRITFIKVHNSHCVCVFTSIPYTKLIDHLYCKQYGTPKCCANVISLITYFICWWCRFVGGKLNVCYNAVDRHVESGRGNQPAIIYDSPVTNTKLIWTYKQLQEEVSTLIASSIIWGAATISYFLHIYTHLLLI